MRYVSTTFGFICMHRVFLFWWLLDYLLGYTVVLLYWLSATHFVLFVDFEIPRYHHCISSLRSCFA